MRQYIKNMRVPIFIIIVLLVLYAILALTAPLRYQKSHERTNNQCPQQRVYDYADKLTDSQEAELEELIAQSESRIACDIVLVVLDEPLEAYAKSYEDQLGHLSEDEYVMVYADNFYDENLYGFDMVHGDGCILVDNWDRSDSAYGYAYNYLSTCGAVYEKFSSDTIQTIIDDVNEWVNLDPYHAYRSYVKNIALYMSPQLFGGVSFPFFIFAIIALVVTIIYVCVHLSANRGKRTTIGTTYVNGGKPAFRLVQDQFLTKHVTRRKIQTSSGSGGGGGGHVSSGGVSHGGGGGHH